jgi:hypothetical protein
LFRETFAATNPASRFRRWPIFKANRNQWNYKAIHQEIPITRNIFFRYASYWCREANDMTYSFFCRRDTDSDRIRDRRLAGRIHVMEPRENVILILPSGNLPMIRLQMIDILHYCLVCAAVAFFGFMAIYAAWVRP